MSVGPELLNRVTWEIPNALASSAPGPAAMGDTRMKHGGVKRH